MGHSSQIAGLFDQKVNANKLTGGFAGRPLVILVCKNRDNV